MYLYIRQPKTMNSSEAIGPESMELQSSVSETAPVSIIRIHIAFCISWSQCAV